MVSETRLKRVCEYYHQLRLLSMRLRVVAYAMGDVVENITPEKAQRVFKLRVVAYSSTWKEPKTATQIWQEYGKDLKKLGRGNACKALDSLLGGCITRVPYESSLDQPRWGRKAKRKSSPGKPPQYAYRPTVTIKADKEDLKRRLLRQMEKDFIKALPFLKRTGVVEEFFQAITDFFVSFTPIMPDFLEGLARMFPKSDFATKVVEKEKNRLGTKKWEKAKMAARNLSEKDLREMREAFESALRSRLNALIELAETRAQ